MDQEEKKWKDYESIVASYRQLAEIRFKLLALLPSISGLAVGVISFDLAAFQQTPLPRFLIGLLGFAVTLGLVIYDKRNSELYFGLSRQAEKLEEEIGATQFKNRPAGDLRFFNLFGINHGPGLSLIYGAVLGAWLFPIFCGIFWGVPTGSRQLLPLSVPVRSAVLAGIGAVIMFCELQRLGSGAKEAKKPDK